MEAVFSSSTKATAARFFRNLGYTDFDEAKTQAREERNRTQPYAYSPGPERVTPGRAAAASQVTASIWPHIEEAVLDEVLAHRTTIVFVNSRGVCERLELRVDQRG